MTLKLTEERLEHRHPQDIIDWALSRYTDIAISFSGAEDVVLIDMAVKTGRPFGVFSLDTGRLHAETYRFLQLVRDHYEVAIEVLSPDATAVQTLVKEKGLFSFYQDGHTECCRIRKVAPLHRKLSSLDAWITGLRHDQNTDTRGDIPVVQNDSTFSGENWPLMKINPLANWSSGQVWQYIQENDVPCNALHKRGYISIGCEPCTRSVLPGQHERLGRWWWENTAEKECGLHFVPVRKVANA